MPECPRCCKYFTSAKCVTLHLAQPKSACNVNLPLERVVINVHRAPFNAAAPDPEDLLPLDDVPGMPAVDWGMGNLDPGLSGFKQETNDLGSDNVQAGGDKPQHASIVVKVLELASILVQVVNIYPGTTVIQDSGQTFLTWFELDPYSIHHKINLYYPFISFSDWEMVKQPIKQINCPRLSTRQHKPLMIG